MAYTRLRYHIITATKHRAPLLTPEVEEVAYAALRKEAERIGGKISHIGGIEDHIHMVAAIPPVIAVSHFIGRIKLESTKGIKHTFAHLEGFEWQVSYGAFTLNPADMSAVVQYVINQKEHHKNNELWERFEQLR